MKITRKQLIVSISSIVNTGGTIYFGKTCNYTLKIEPILNGYKKALASCYLNGVWDKYMFNSDVDGITKMLKFLTLNQLLGKEHVTFSPIGEENIVKCRFNLRKITNKTKGIK